MTVAFGQASAGRGRANGDQIRRLNYTANARSAASGSRSTIRSNERTAGSRLVRDCSQLRTVATGTPMAAANASCARASAGSACPSSGPNRNDCYANSVERKGRICALLYPIRSSLAPAARSQGIAALVCGVNASTCAQNFGLWFIWRKCATSCATT
jgi:hypothetical protein